MKIENKNVIVNEEKQSRLKINHTEYFLINGEFTSGGEKTLSDNVKENGNIILLYKDQIKEGQKISSIIHAIEEILGLKIKKTGNIDYYVDNYHNIITPNHILTYIIPYIKKRNEKNYQSKINNIKFFGEKLGININNEVLESSIYILSKDKEWHTNTAGCSEAMNRSMYFLFGAENKRSFYHEYGHHIGEQQKIKNFEGCDYDITGGYTSRLGSVFMDEAFTELFAYGCQKIEKGKNSKLDPNISYNFHTKSIAKLMQIAAKKLGKSNEYIYNYMMRGYLIRGNKGLNIFYKAFGREFLRELMMLGTNFTNKVLFIRLVKEHYLILGFSNNKKAKEFFGTNIKPSQEIGDIMGIER